jgi:flagella synthesis protein FlgN
MSGVAELTEREIPLISRFVSLLQQERDCLTRVDVAALEEVGHAKIALAEQLDALETERRTLLQLGPLENTREGMANWLNKHPEDSNVAVNWEKLLNLAAEAKALHELNAKLLGIHLQQTTEALAVLTRQAENVSLYGSNGQTALSSGSRIVDSA